MNQDKHNLIEGYLGKCNHAPVYSNIKKWKTFFKSSSFHGHLNEVNVSIHSEDNGFTDLYITDSWGINKNSIDASDTVDRIKQAKQKKLPIIAFFGGSTLKGVGCGIPEYTIPSLVEKEMKARYGLDVICVNHGIAGWYCADQFHYLLHKIPYDPDFVVYYDGWNCLWNLYNGFLINEKKENTWHKGTSLRHVEYDVLNTKLFQSTYLLKRGLNLFFNKTLDRIANFFKYKFWNRFWTYLAIKTFPINRINPVEGLHKYSLNEKDRDKIMNSVANEYIRIHDLTKTICESRKIKFIHYLQPILETTTRDLSEKEKKILTVGVKMGNPEIFSLFPEFINNNGWPIELVDLSKIFDDTVEDIFVNDGHLNKFGNAHVAKKIVQDLYSKIYSK